MRSENGVSKQVALMIAERVAVGSYLLTRLILLNQPHSTSGKGLMEV